MSNIPFVNQLGDAIESALTAPEPVRRRRRRRRRVAAVAIAVFAIGATGTTIAALVDGGDEVALGNINCYESADLSGGFQRLVADGEAPAAVCAAAWSAQGREPRPLVACWPNGDGVAVIPGKGPAACGRVGLKPLPPRLALAQPKVARLARDVAAIEQGEECISPVEMRRRVQALLDRPAWSGWRARLEPGDGGPCGWVRIPGGAEDVSLASKLRADLAELRVSTGPPRSFYRLVYGADGVGMALIEASGERCFTVDDLRGLAVEKLAAADLPVEVVSRPVEPNTGLTPAARQRRYEQGCAVARGVAPVYGESGVAAVELEIALKDG